MLKNNKGITLIALVVTIIVILILASVGIYYGRSTIKSVKFERLSTQMQSLQLRVNELYQEYEGNKEGEILVNNIETKVEDLGTSLSDSNKEVLNTLSTRDDINIGNIDDYRYYSVENIEEIMKLEDIEIEFLINIKLRRIVIADGYEYKGNTYYVLEDFDTNLFNVDYNGFKYSVQDNVGYSTITISEVVFKGEDVTKRLPNEYQEVEYIESTGTQCIELPFGFDKTDEVTFKFSINTEENGEDKYMVSPKSWNNNNNRYAMGVHKTYYTSGYGGAWTKDTKRMEATSNDGNFHTWSYNNYIYKVTDLNLTKDCSNITFGSETTNLKLFYGYNAPTKGKIAYYYHKKDNGKAYYFIPCYRKLDSVIGLYDYINNIFYENSGSGLFTKGNDVENKDNYRVGYKKSDSAEWTYSYNNNIMIEDAGKYSLKVIFESGEEIQYDNIQVNTKDEVVNSPELDDNMIPVTWDRGRLSWVKADKTNFNNSWYNYNQDINQFANVVTVYENGTNSRAYYKNADIGTEILMSDINSMFVWIPRFTYKATKDNSGNIISIDKISYSNGTIDSTNNINTGLNFGSNKGIWVAKFESGKNSSEKIYIKPNVSSWNNISYNDASTISANVSINNKFSNTKTISSICTTSAWNAATILSKGITNNTNIYNNSYFDGTNTRTGMAGVKLEHNGDIATDPYNATTASTFTNTSSTEDTGVITLTDANTNSNTYYEYWTDNGQKASSTQNIYGIYDLAGNCKEFITDGTNTYIVGNNYTETPNILTEGTQIKELTTGYEDVSYRVILTPNSSIQTKYQKVAYIESTGTQYINLPFGFNNKDEVIFKFSVNTGQSYDKYMVSPISWNTNNNRYAMGVHNGIYTIGYGIGFTGNTGMVPSISNDGNIHTWSYNNYTYKVTDLNLTRDCSNITFGGETANLRLFYGYNAPTKGKIVNYYHKKENGYEYNFIPCYCKLEVTDVNGNICSVNTIGMYDTINDKFYTNSGSGTFNVGSDIN